MTPPGGRLFPHAVLLTGTAAGTLDRCYAAVFSGSTNFTATRADAAVVRRRNTLNTDGLHETDYTPLGKAVSLITLGSRRSEGRGAAKIDEEMDRILDRNRR